jgi:uncharacterized membrane protein
MNIHKNKFLDSLFKLMLLSAVIHMTIMFTYSVVHMDFSEFNIFNIFDLDLFFPEIGIGVLSAVLSLLLTIAIYSFFLRNRISSDKKNEAKNQGDQAEDETR